MSSPSTTTTKSPTAAEDIMMMNDMDIPVGLINSKKLLTEAQYTLCENLARLGQEHLFSEAFDAMPPANKRKLAQQLQELDEEYGRGGSGSGSGNVGGLVWYIRNARVLLENSRLGVNPLKGWTPTLPTGQAFDFSSPEYEATEALGTQQLGAVGFVLVAGGLGERLGFNNIKLSLPTEMTTETCYLQHYIEYILAVQADHHNGNSSGKQLPLCIMTSGDTHKKTVALLQERHYFGMDQSQITIVQQGQGVPALCDNRGKFVLAPGDPSQLVVKPHGHGDVHKLLYTHGVARRWHNELGIAWLVLFQDTNGLAFHTLPLMLGVSARMNLIMNSLAVPRKAKQAIGGIARLVNDSTGEVKTLNVEYNQLDPLLRSTRGFENGDENDPNTGYSPFPGNINQLLFKLDDYCQALDASKGLMPEFVNPKYSDANKTIFKSPTRLECMMQDFPTILDKNNTSRVGFTSISADLCFSPVKNATADGVVLQAQQTNPGTAASGEADQYAAQRKILRAIGCDVTDAAEEEYDGIKVVPGPAIVLKPNFVKTLEDYKNKFPTPDKVKISARSTLVVRGKNVDIYSLDLDGTLIIDVPNDDCLEIRDLVVKNEGWVRVKVDETTATATVDEIIKMRGYRIEKREGLTIRTASDMKDTTPNSPPKFAGSASFDDQANCGVFACFK